MKKQQKEESCVLFFKESLCLHCWRKLGGKTAQGKVFFSRETYKGGKLVSNVSNKMKKQQKEESCVLFFKESWCLHYWRKLGGKTAQGKVFFSRETYKGGSLSLICQWAS